MNPIVKSEIKESLDQLNIRWGLSGQITEDELILVLVQSTLKASTSEIKDFVHAIPKARTQSGQLVMSLEDLKRII